MCPRWAEQSGKLSPVPENDPPVKLKSIFVISPIAKKDEDGFDFTKLFLDHIVKPAAVQATGFSTPVRADEPQIPGSINARVFNDIVKADVCVADLTGRNPNVMYEVAIAHAADKQVILLQQEPGGGPFDFADQNVIHYSPRADEANKARDDLAQQLRNANSDKDDERLSGLMHPVRMIFRDMMTKAQATEPERAIFERIDQLGGQIAAMEMYVRRYSFPPSRGWSTTEGRDRPTPGIAPHLYRSLRMAVEATDAAAVAKLLPVIDMVIDRDPDDAVIQLRRIARMAREGNYDTALLRLRHPSMQTLWAEPTLDEDLPTEPAS